MTVRYIRTRLWPHFQPKKLRFSRTKQRSSLFFSWHRQIEIQEELEIMNPPCPNCEDILQRVSISSERKMHVIQRHYSSECVQDRPTSTYNIHPCFFFEEVVDRLRSGVLEGATHRRRLIYFCEFNFIVGHFPHRGRLRGTNFVKVVCTKSCC